MGRGGFHAPASINGGGEGHVVIDFRKIDLHEPQTLVLKNASGETIGPLGYATDVEFEINYNEVSEITFDYPAYVDGEETPFFDDLTGMRMITVDNLGRYTLIDPEIRDDGILRVKQCKAYSLEYEFTYKKLTIGYDTYKFWDTDPERQPGTILGMILQLMPMWKVGTISWTLINKYRTFEISNENLYNFIKSTCQQTYGCIFDFDTDARKINIRDVEDEAQNQPVFLSTDNLAKNITIKEDSENLVTRLDVNGADGVNIRDVNPIGTNYIINLDHFMDTSNFDQALIDKYYAWKELCANVRPTYFAKSINYSLAVMQEAAEQAKLIDMNGELTSLDNQRAVIIDAIAQNISQQSDLDTANAQYEAQKTVIANQEEKIATIAAKKKSTMQELEEIVNQCSYNKYFTGAERQRMDLYIRDGEITDESFVSMTTVYTDDGTSMNLEGKRFAIWSAEVTETVTDTETLYSIRGGIINIADSLYSEMINSVMSVAQDGSFVFTAALGAGHIDGMEFTSGSLTATGTQSNKTNDELSVSMDVNGYLYFTLNPSEYQLRSVAWDLYEYGEEMAKRLAQPTYSFSVSSANFFALDEFEEFKNKLRLGEKIYLDIKSEILNPICIGVSFSYGDETKLDLKFGDSYVQSDTAFKLADLLEQSVSMGRTVSASKFNYEAFQRTGASVGIREFMNSALDVSKNSILSSQDQAISWDAAGLRLRRYANENQSAYEDEQI